MLPLPPHLNHPAALHGLSAFSTIRLHWGQPLLWPEHLARLAYTCAYLGLSAPETVLPELDTDLEWQLLRLTVTEQGTFYSVRPLSLGPRPTGVTVYLSGVQVHPQLSRHKTGNYLPYTLALREAQQRGAFEAWLSDGPHLADGARTSPLLELGGELVVPAGGLPSITRAAYLATVPHTVRPVALGELSRLTQAWICGAGVGIVPVQQLQGPGLDVALQADWPAQPAPFAQWPE